MEDKKDKSVLDGIPVEDKAFPLPPNGRVVPKGGSGTAPLERLLTVISHCPECKNPIYGRATIMSGDEPVVKRSCCCTSRGQYPLEAK